MVKDIDEIAIMGHQTMCSRCQFDELCGKLIQGGTTVDRRICNDLVETENCKLQCGIFIFR